MIITNYKTVFKIDGINMRENMEDFYKKKSYIKK